MGTARSERYSRRHGVSHIHLVTIIVWIMRDGSLNQGKLCLPVMGQRIKSCESLWVLGLLYYPESGTGWWWDQIPHCRWGRCTGSCHRSSHTGPPRTVPGSSRTRSRLRETGQEGSLRFRHVCMYTQACAQLALVIILFEEWFISSWQKYTTHEVTINTFLRGWITLDFFSCSENDFLSQPKRCFLLYLWDYGKRLFWLSETNLLLFWRVFWYFTVFWCLHSCKICSLFLQFQIVCVEFLNSITFAANNWYVVFSYFALIF